MIKLTPTKQQIKQANSQIRKNLAVLRKEVRDA